MVEFAIFVFFISIIVIFMGEIGETAKSAWGSDHVRNIGLLVLLSLFGIHYQWLVQTMLLGVIYYWRESVRFVFVHLHFFKGAEDFAMLLFLFLFTYMPVYVIEGVYWLIKRKSLRNKCSIVWFFWVLLMSLLILV